MNSINYILADNQDLSCMGFRYLITELGGKQIDCVRTKSELDAKLKANKESLVIFDFALFDWSNLEELTTMADAFPDSRWLCVIDIIDEQFIHQLTSQLPEVNIALKTGSKEELSAAIIAAKHNKKYYCSEALDIILGNKKRKAETVDIKVQQLTPTEKEIVQLLALGKTTKDIANERHLSYHTVITHRKNIFRKLELNSVHELTRYALKNGLADVTEYYI